MPVVFGWVGGVVLDEREAMSEREREREVEREGWGVNDDNDDDDDNDDRVHKYPPWTSSSGTRKRNCEMA